MTGHRVRLARDQVHDLAEGPRWDDLGQSVSWVDIARGRVFQGTVDGDSISVARRLDFPATVGAAVPTSEGGLLVAAHDHLAAVSPDGTRRSATVVDSSQRLRLNDAAVDPRGRLLVGSLATDGRTGAAQLFRLDADGGTTVLRSRMNLTNGIGWSPDGATLYVADSVPGVLWSASYDLDAGYAHSWTALVTEFDGLPDGLCVDADGRVWVALWNGSQVACFSPLGRRLDTVRLPVPHVTAVAFVGVSRDRLLITSARDELDDDARARYPGSGCLFLADVDAVGLPTSRWSSTTDGPGWTDAPAPVSDPDQTSAGHAR